MCRSLRTLLNIDVNNKNAAFPEINALAPPQQRLLAV